jgi:hypothetical protein
MIEWEKENIQLILFEFKTDFLLVNGNFMSLFTYFSVYTDEENRNIFYAVFTLISDRICAIKVLNLIS